MDKLALRLAKIIRKKLNKYGVASDMYEDFDYDLSLDIAKHILDSKPKEREIVKKNIDIDDYICNEVNNDVNGALKEWQHNMEK